MGKVKLLIEIPEYLYEEIMCMPEDPSLNSLEYAIQKGEIKEPLAYPYFPKYVGFFTKKDNNYICDFCG